MSKTITEPEDNNESAPLVACAWCSLPFELYPDCFVETGLSPAELNDEEEAVLCDQLGVPPEGILTKEVLATMTPEELKVFDITPEQRDALLRGEDITTGVSAVCEACMKRFDEEGYVP